MSTCMCKCVYMKRQAGGQRVVVTNRKKTR